MQGWGRETLQPSRKHVAEKVKVAARDNQKCTSLDYRAQLEKDVEKLQHKLKQEIETHKALERAFRRTLGVLPRFSPSLSPKVQALLAEVAVLEEEVINLEECIVSLRQGLYTEAVCLSTLKQQNKASVIMLESSAMKVGKNVKLPPLVNDMQGKRNPVIVRLLPANAENKADASFPILGKHTHGMAKKVQIDRSVSGKISNGSCSFKLSSQTNTKGEQEMVLETEGKQKPSKIKSQRSMSGKNAKAMLSASKVATSRLERGNTLESNLLSEEMVWCIAHIFLKLTRPGSFSDCETSSAISDSTSSTSFWSHTSRNSFSINPSTDITEELEFSDPYRICHEMVHWDVGSYRYYHEITASSLDYSRIPRSTNSLRKLMVLIEKLGSVDLHGLTHKQKLAFWINIYNVCMMHAFLEHGVPSSPHQVVALMGKAVINVGGHHLSALAIEHFILRLPLDPNMVEWKGQEADSGSSTYGLEWPEPLVSFALCCGSWSSPVVRIYTPLEVDNELQVAKAEYLQAAVRVAPTKVVIPKLLDWYMWDFAKDVESFMEWLSEQLPNSIGKSVQKLMANVHGKVISDVVEVVPYDFNFRYLFALPP